MLARDAILSPLFRRSGVALLAADFSFYISRARGILKAVGASRS
jgi:hypothetical protein